jgi:hypothetical protein
MTAREIIDNALTLDETSSMLTLIKAKRDLNMISDAITGAQIVHDWSGAYIHIEGCIDEQHKLAIAGETVRIW